MMRYSPPRAPVPPQGNPWDSRASSGMELTQVQEQTEHRAHLGREVPTVELAKCALTKQLSGLRGSQAGLALQPNFANITSALWLKN